MEFEKRIEKMKKLEKPVLRMYALGKFLVILGAGALIASYLKDYDWKFWGLVLVVIGVLIKIPGFLKLNQK